MCLGHTVGSGSSLMRLGYSLVSLPPAAFNGLKRFSTPRGRLSLLFRVCICSFLCVCVCVCVSENDRERETDTESTVAHVFVSLHLLKVLTGAC